MRLTPGCSLARKYQTRLDVIEVVNALAYYYMETVTAIQTL
jgi:hypothetical protein